MKSRPQKIKEIYRELRSILGETVTSHEILSLAATIVKTAEHPKIDYSHREHLGRLPLYRVNLIEALEDGGWRVLQEECGAAINAYDDDCDSRLVPPSQELKVSQSYTELVI